MEQLYDTKTVIWSDRVEITKYANPIKVGQQIESRPPPQKNSGVTSVELHTIGSGFAIFVHWRLKMISAPF